MKKGGDGYFQNSGGSWLKGGVKKFREFWTLDEAMIIEYALCRVFISTYCLLERFYMFNVNLPNKTFRCIITFILASLRKLKFHVT